MPQRRAGISGRLILALAYRDTATHVPTICRTFGNVCWHVRAGWENILLGPLGLRLEEWIRQGQAEVIKDGLHRTVYRVELADREFFVKYYRCPQTFRAVRHLVRSSAARREWQTALEIARRNIPTATPIALGEQRRGGLVTESYYLTEAIPQARSLDDYVTQVLPCLPADRRLKCRRQLIRAMAELAAAVHRAGVRHHDFHTGNILLHGTPASNELAKPQLYLIDLPNVRFSGPLDWRQSRHSLVMLHAGWFDHLSSSDRLRFWQAYLAGRCDLQLAHARQAAAEIVADTTAFAQHIVRGRDKRALRTNRDFVRLAVAEGVAHAVRQVPGQEVLRLLRDPMQPIRQYRHWPVKLSHSSLVVEAELRLLDGLVKVAYKRSRRKNWWKRCLGLFRTSRALQGWKRGHALLQRGIATARPLLVCQPRQGLLPRDSYLATVWIEGAQNLHLFGWELARRDAVHRRRRVRQCAVSLGRLLGRMHAWNVVHRDLKACNLVVVEQLAGIDAYVIDLDGVQLRRRLRWSTQVQNLARLAISLEAHPWITRTDRLRFLRAYQTQFKALPRNDWKDLWHAVATLCRDSVARNRKLDKPIA